MNDCGGFENEKEDNGCPPEMNGWGEGSIYELGVHGRRIGQVKF